MIADDPTQWINSNAEAGQALTADAEQVSSYLLRRWTQAAGEAARLRREMELIKATPGRPESPLIRQHNAISKWVAGQLATAPGRDRHTILFLAGILDMEIPDTWLASQD